MLYKNSIDSMIHETLRTKCAKMFRTALTIKLQKVLYEGIMYAVVRTKFL